MENKLADQIEELQVRLMKQNWTAENGKVEITSEDAARIIHLLDWMRNFFLKTEEIKL